MAGTTGLEPAASAVTGRRSNQLNYVPTRQINKMQNNQCLSGFARFAYRAPVVPDCPKERDSCPNRPQTASKSRRSRALLRFPKQPAQRAPADLEFRQSGQNDQRNFRKSLSQKYPNSFSQNTKDHLHFPKGRTDRNSQIRRQADTSCLCDRAAASALQLQWPDWTCSWITRDLGREERRRRTTESQQTYQITNARLLLPGLQMRLKR